jgi:hypothetical protein
MIFLLSGAMLLISSGAIGVYGMWWFMRCDACDCDVDCVYCNH